MITGQTLRDAILSGANNIANQRVRVDELNVFPVPDGDTGTDIVKMTYRLARSMKKKDSQFITVISGCDVSDEDAEKTTEMVRTKCGSSVEVSHISGGQPVYYYMISVE